MYIKIKERGEDAWMYITDFTSFNISDVQHLPPSMPLVGNKVKLRGRVLTISRYVGGERKRSKLAFNTLCYVYDNNGNVAGKYIG